MICNLHSPTLIHPWGVSGFTSVNLGAPLGCDSWLGSKLLGLEEAADGDGADNDAQQDADSQLDAD